MCALRVAGFVCGAAVAGVGGIISCESCLSRYPFLYMKYDVVRATRFCCAATAGSCFALALVPRSPVAMAACAGVWIAAAIATCRAIRKVHANLLEGDNWQNAAKNVVMSAVVRSVVFTAPGWLLAAGACRRA